MREDMKTYHEGQTITLRCTITDPDDGTPVDPASVTLQVRSPRGVISAVSTSRESAGVFAAPFTPAEHGVWAYRFVGSGVETAVDEGRFFVLRSSFV